LTISTWNPPQLTDDEIEARLGNHSGLVGVDRTRMSRLICEQLAFGIASRTLDSFAVTDVLQALEGHPKYNHMKREPFNHPQRRGPFKRIPLKGLLHAHFLQAAFVPKNIDLEMKNDDSKVQIDKVIENTNLSVDEKVKISSYKGTIGMYKSRSDRGALTGEWIIYAENLGRRYYLAIAPHFECDMVIYNRMMERCEEHFQHIILSATS